MTRLSAYHYLVSRRKLHNVLNGWRPSRPLIYLKQRCVLVAWYEVRHKVSVVDSIRDQEGLPAPHVGLYLTDGGWV